MEATELPKNGSPFTPGDSIECLYNKIWYQARVDQIVSAGIRVFFPCDKTTIVIQHKLASTHIKKQKDDNNSNNESITLKAMAKVDKTHNVPLGYVGDPKTVLFGVKETHHPKSLLNSLSTCESIYSSDEGSETSDESPVIVNKMVKKKQKPRAKQNPLKRTKDPITNRLILPEKPDLERNDLPPPEKYDEWLNSIYSKDRFKKAHGWRKTLGCKANADSFSGYRHVFQANFGRSFSARVAFQGKKYYVGTFPSKEEAANAADRQSVKLGLMAHELNFPELYDKHVAMIARENNNSHSNILSQVDCSFNNEPDFVKMPEKNKDKSSFQKVTATSGYRGVHACSKTKPIFSVEVNFQNRKYFLRGEKLTKEQAARIFDVKIVSLGKATIEPRCLNFRNEWNDNILNQYQEDKIDENNNDFGTEITTLSNEEVKLITSRPDVMKALKTLEIVTLRSLKKPMSAKQKESLLTRKDVRRRKRQQQKKAIEDEDIDENENENGKDLPEDKKNKSRQTRKKRKVSSETHKEQNGMHDDEVDESNNKAEEVFYNNVIVGLPMRNEEELEHDQTKSKAVRYAFV